jgi:hypothetical protein
MYTSLDDNAVRQSYHRGADQNWLLMRKTAKDNQAFSTF